MSDKKVSQLQRLPNPQPTDLLLIIDMKSDIPVSKNISLAELFANISTDSLAINKIIIKETKTPVDNIDATIDTGEIFFDENFLYIKVNETEIKRIPLEAF